jgi:hypothetical protein
VLNQRQGYLLFSNALTVAISLICQFQVDGFGPNYSETQDFDWELQVFRQNIHKQMVQVLNPFLSFMFSFQNNKAHKMLCMMLNPCYKGLGLVIQFVGKERALQIGSKYYHHVLLASTSYF